MMISFLVRRKRKVIPVRSGSPRSVHAEIDVGDFDVLMPGDGDLVDEAQLDGLGLMIGDRDFILESPLFSRAEDAGFVFIADQFFAFDAHAFVNPEA
jgi:hypothetical protein